MFNEPVPEVSSIRFYLYDNIFGKLPIGESKQLTYKVSPKFIGLFATTFYSLRESYTYYVDYNLHIFPVTIAIVSDTRALSQVLNKV